MDPDGLQIGVLLGAVVGIPLALMAFSRPYEGRSKPAKTDTGGMTGCTVVLLCLLVVAIGLLITTMGGGG